MIAFAACVGTPAKLAACAAPGLARAMEADSVFAELTSSRSIHEAYNEALAHFSAADGLEALVLLHEDTELLDGDFCARVARPVGGDRGRRRRVRSSFAALVGGRDRGARGRAPRGRCGRARPV